MQSTYYYRGLAYLFMGNFDDLAIENLNKAIEQNSDHADAYYYRGAAYNFKGEVELAIEDYTNAIDTQTRLCRGLLQSGDSL